MSRRRLIPVMILTLALLASMAAPVSAGTALRKLTTTGWYTIFQTFVHNGSTEPGCDGHDGSRYTVQMSAYVYYGGGTTFKVVDVTVKVTVTTGIVWADYFLMFGSYSATRWPASGYKWQGDLLYAGQSRTYTYHPSKTVTKDATLQEQSYFDIPGLPNSCNVTDYWALFVY